MSIIYLIRLLFKILLFSLATTLILLVIHQSQLPKANGDVKSAHLAQLNIKNQEPMDKIVLMTTKNSVTRNHPQQHCSNITRPTADDIQWRNHRWQYFINGIREVYILDAYYDDRGDVPLIRICPVAVVPEGHLPGDDTLYALLWYDDLANPIPVTCPCKANHTTSFWHIKKKQYGILYHDIALNRTDRLPTHISMMAAPCAQPKTYLKVVIPEKPKSPSRDIGLCVKAIWGDFTYRNAPYFVNWMESLRILGLKRVYIYTSGLDLRDDVIKRVFSHYVKSGFLYTEFLHNNLYETPQVEMNKQISQALVLTVINDCFLRHMHKYEFMLHHDTDEILIPRHNQTYRQLLDDFMGEDERYVNYEALLSRSAFFYTYYEASHREQPAYMTFLRHAYRQPIEIPGVTWHRGNGVMKAFMNSRTCALMNIHGCKRTVRGDGSRGYGHTFIPPQSVIIHHYRSECKLKGRCETEVQRRLVDTTIRDTFGRALTVNVRDVLQSAGYFSYAP